MTDRRGMLIRGADVVDGTGEPARRCDVRVADGVVTEVGPALRPDGDEVHDLGGLVLAPGFIDIHTHYDAQVLWDPELTPSSWHGVTTVVMGNCGFGVAPTRPEDRETVIRTLEKVEGMSAEALAAGIDWSFETFPEYLDALDRAPKQLNVAAFVGHTPVRLYVLGDEAAERAATADEVSRMRDLVRQALQAGAVGFATSRAPTHIGAGGKPVPSRLAELDEIDALAGVLGDVGVGVLQATVGSGLFIDEFAAISKRTGRPVTWTALVTGIDYEALFGGRVASSDSTRGAATAMVERTAAAGGHVVPQVACRPVVARLTLREPFILGSLPAFRDVMAAPPDARAAVYRDAAWRDRARPEAHAMWSRWWAKTSVDETERHGAVRGRTLADLAAEQGADPFDVMLDLALAEDLATRFLLVTANDDEEEVGALLRDERTVLGLSDAGAHADMLCDACFSTHLLGHWVRENGVLSLEQAVWRLSGQVADLLGLPDRGRLRVGAAADLVAFDPATVAAGPLERRHDFPAGAERLVAPSIGIEHVWVNGMPIRRDATPVDGARPGVVVRSRP